MRSLFTYPFVATFLTVPARGYEVWLTLRKSDSRIVTVPISKLSGADRTYLERKK